MKKLILILGAIVIGLVLVGVIIGVMFDDRKGLVHVISVTPSSESPIAADTEITITAAYLLWEYSSEVDFYAGLYFNSTSYMRYKAGETKLPAIMGTVTFKTTLTEVMCGLEPIVRESNSPSEITEKLFDKFFKKGMIHRFQEEVLRLKGCRYGKVKYPFELMVQTFYRFKNVNNSGYIIDESDNSIFKVKQ